MNKLLIFSCFFIFSMHSVNSQKLTLAAVPAAVKSTFEQKYPAVKGKWEKEQENYEVNFIQGGKMMSCVINKEGQLVETETAMAIRDLNPVIHHYLNEHYKGYSIKEAAKIVKANGEINYEAEVKGKDVLFAADGTFIKEAKD